MTQPSHIPLAAFVSESERPAIQGAAVHIARALSEAAGVPWTCDCVFASNFEALRPGDAASIIITSLLPQLGRLEESWPEVERRLRTSYAALCKQGAPVFICTVLRHVSHDEEPGTASALRIRIRRLNLLAADISRETGAFIVDLDRVLANIGARQLRTDYRLAGEAGTALAAHFIALTLVTDALDAFVLFEVQDAARQILMSSQPELGASDTASPEIVLRKDMMSMGQGRRKQVVWPVVYTAQESHSGWLVHQVLRGTISPQEALQRLIAAIRKRGLRESTLLLASGLARQFHQKK